MRTGTVPLALLAVALTGVAAPPANAQPGRAEWREVFAPDGTITRARITRIVPDAPAPKAAAAAAEVVPIEVNGPSASKFDLVFVGDGYTSGQLATYGGHVRGKFNEIMATEPFRSHRTQFNVWQVNVISPQSGVDNDPTRGVSRSTALDMGFWCGNTERLLCVNETKARQYAAQAPGVDQVLALGNSTKYGGAGGGVATASGGNGSSGQIAIHELGHSIGRLADEYDYGGGDLYTGGEPREPNVSIYTSATLRQYRLKWHQWLGQQSPDGGIVDSYQGARYYRRGIYRPTQNSIMRTLGRQFNLPGREAMIAGFYRTSGVVEGSSAVAGGPLWVRPARSGSAQVETTWRVDGRPVARGETLDVAALRLPKGTHTVTATVLDRTPMVRDQALRARWMTATRTWTITV